MDYPKNLLKPILVYLKRLEGDLLRRKGELKKEDPYADTSRFNDNASDDAEAASQFGHAQSEVLSKETEAALTRVRQTMNRVEQGEYGKCLKCKKMIDTDRLGIDPTAEYCVNCAKSKG
ncbi:MAG: hypothetical protein UY18_C0004G0032 [Microgenomates group bacterium GW2011_GWF2_47_9]|nr:MAG: hypothetical protein UY18_C0004G0032 [Microgenomates group bacterium GW2011_GWF2_47_9]